MGARPVIEPGPRTARKEPGLYPTKTAAFLYLALAVGLSGIIVTVALLIYLIAEGRL